MYVCIHSSVPVCSHVCICVCMDTCMHVCIYVCLFVYITCMHACMYVFVYAYNYVVGTSEFSTPICLDSSLESYACQPRISKNTYVCVCKFVLDYACVFD